MSRRFDRFVNALAEIEVSPRAYNQYSRAAGDLVGNATRRRNLRLYFDELTAIRPRLLLVGEAPSYRGGRLTGIPFVSETILLAGVTLRGAPHRILGSDRGYRKATPGPRLSTEASATMVWETIREIDPLPVLWNAFPFHPHEAGNARTNRAPSAAELLTGERFVEWLIRLLPIECVAAVGNHADATLTRLGISHQKVRHPSQGGKQRFVEGLARLSQFRIA